MVPSPWQSGGPITLASDTAFALCGLVTAGFIALYIFERGSVGARRIGALLTDTAPGQILGGLAGLVLALASMSAAAAAQGWGSWLVSVLPAVFWGAMGLRGLRNGCRNWAARREALRNGPAVERIP